MRCKGESPWLGICGGSAHVHHSPVRWCSPDILSQRATVGEHGRRLVQRAHIVCVCLCANQRFAGNVSSHEIHAIQCVVFQPVDFWQIVQPRRFVCLEEQNRESADSPLYVWYAAWQMQLGHLILHPADTYFNTSSREDLLHIS